MNPKDPFGGCALASRSPLENPWNSSGLEPDVQSKVFWICWLRSCVAGQTLSSCELCKARWLFKVSVIYKFCGEGELSEISNLAI